MNAENKTSLADKIADILNTAPSGFDPEDESIDATNAQVSNVDFKDFHEEEEILSKFRRANVDLLADLDEKYAGKKISRKKRKDSDSDDTQSTTEKSGSDDDENDDHNENTLDSLESESASSDISGDASGDESIEETHSEEENEEMVESESSQDDNFQHIKETNVSNQIKKGLCVRNQLAMWENLLEVRIQLQKCLLIANKLPQTNTFDNMKQESGPEFSNKVSQTKSNVFNTLEKLLLLQKLLLKQYPETKNLEKQNTSTDSNEIDEEEIPSDTDHEQSSNEEEVEEEVKTGRKRKLENYEQELTNQHKIYKNYRNSVIQKWNDKTRLALKGGASSHSVLDQIEYSLSNKEKLIKRTQIKRSQYTILGETTNDTKTDEECNPEIFDDDDFYHQLLRELIEVKSADVTDPIQLGQQWIQLQNLRSKMKRKIDTRATKGRKIRYAVHSKLVNFMAPIDESSWNDEAKNELYNSLFAACLIHKN